MNEMFSQAFDKEGAIGKDYFWDFLTRQVENHNFAIRTFRNDTWAWSGTVNLNTSCSYNGGDVYRAEVGAGPNDKVNVLFVTPSSPETYADYTNGVSTLDIVLIIRYLNDSVSFNNWAITAADVNYSMSVDTHDVNAIRDLILGIKSNYGTNGRKSWGWVPHSDVLSFTTGSNPFQYPVGGPGYAEWWSPSPRSRNEIVNASFNDLKFFSIKFGDVFGNSSGSSNSWICGSGSYGSSFRENNVQTRSVVDQRLEYEYWPLKKGDEVEIEINLDWLSGPLSGYQMYIDADQKKGELMRISYEADVKPYTNYNPFINSQVFLEYSKDQNPLKIEEGRMMTLRYRILEDMSNYQDFIQWAESSMQEWIGIDGELVDAGISMKLGKVIRKEMNITYMNYGGNPVVRVQTPNNSESEITIVDLGGRIWYNRRHTLNEGLNDIPIGRAIQPGLYILNVSNTSDQKSIKFFVE